jgi:hypothetical protein
LLLHDIPCVTIKFPNEFLNVSVANAERSRDLTAAPSRFFDLVPPPSKRLNQSGFLQAAPRQRRTPICLRFLQVSS